MSLGYRQLLGLLAGGGSAPYSFRKSQYAPRIYGVQAVGAAANSSSWVSGQANTTGYITSHVCMDAEAPFDQVAFVFANSETAGSYAIAGVSAAVGDTLNDPQNTTSANRGNFVQVTFGGLSTTTIPAAPSSTLPSFVVSDFANLSSITRAAGDSTTWSIAGGKLADSYTRPLLHFRVAQPITGGVATAKILGYAFNANNADAPFNPRQPSKTGRYVHVMSASDATVQTSVGSTAALTGTTYGPFTGIVYLPVIGVIFKYRNSNAMTFWQLGDSITYGASVGVIGAGDSASTGLPPSGSWASLMTQYVSTMAQPVEFANLGWSGSTTTQFVARVQAILAAGVTPPTHLTYASFSPNDGSQGPGATQTTNLASILTLCQSNNIYPLLWTGLPVGTQAGQALTNAGELARLAWNTTIRNQTIGTGGIDYVEIDQGGDGSGQIMSDNVSPIASITNTPVQWHQQSAANSLHPNYSGNAVMRQLFTAKASSIATRYFAP